MFRFPLILFILFCSFSLISAIDSSLPSRSVHLFYYLWYGNPEFDGRWLHWNHSVIPHWNKDTRELYDYGSLYQAPDDQGAPYRPFRGLYSSRDPSLLLSHMKSIKEAGIGVVVASWWGRPDHPKAYDGEGVRTDSYMILLLDAAEKEGIKIAIHLEPYEGRSPSTVREDLAYLVDHYASHPAWYRDNEGRSWYYVYDAYHNPSSEWAELFSPSSPTTIRNTAMDGVFISLLLDDNMINFVEQGYFDGFYTYFASNEFTQAANWGRWPSYCKAAKRLQKKGGEEGKRYYFIPSVAPGYDDGRIRPWNTQWTQHRRNGAYYDESWQSAIYLSCVDTVSITSFNEWGEGTQIEEAIPYMSSKGKHALDYLPNEPDYYMKRTNYWIHQWFQIQEERERKNKENVDKHQDL